MRLLAILLAILVASPANAREPSLPALPFVRTGPWVANYDVDSCQLTGEFRFEDRRITVRFTRYQPGDAFDLMLIGDMLERSARTADLTLSFGLSPRPDRVVALTGYSGATPMMMINWVRLDGWQAAKSGDKPPAAVSPQQEGQVSALTIGLSRSRSIRLELGSMAKPMETMRNCIDTLQRFWGYDPARIAAQTRPAAPAGNPNSWLRSVDYPRGPLGSGRSGVVRVRLDLDEAGKPIACRVLAQAGPSDFAKAACEGLMRRSQFTPALDADGKPMKTYVINSVTFYMVR